MQGPLQPSIAQADTIPTLFGMVCMHQLPQAAVHGATRGSKDLLNSPTEVQGEESHRLLALAACQVTQHQAAVAGAAGAPAALHMQSDNAM
jgi:hypothetical protein